METQEQIQPEVVEDVNQTVEVATETAPETDGAFESGFAAASGQEPEPQPEPQPEPEAPKLIAGYTEDQLKDLLAKAQEVDRLKEREAKVFGTLGSLKQQLDNLRAQPQATAQISKDRFKRLSAEFPEMAEMLAEDLSGAIAAPAFDESIVDRRIDEKLTSATRTYESKLLSVMHPDWRQIIQTPEFGEWRKTLSPEDDRILEDSWDASSIGERLSAFKGWRTQSTKQTNQRRLEAAITPRASARSAPVETAEDAFVSGFKSARGIK